MYYPINMAENSGTQKVFNILSVLSFLGLVFFGFMFWRQNQALSSLISKLPTPPPTPEPAEPPVVNNGTTRKTVTGKELWDAMQEKVKEMTVDLKFNNNN